MIIHISIRVSRSRRLDFNKFGTSIGNLSYTVYITSSQLRIPRSTITIRKNSREVRTFEARILRDSRVLLWLGRSIKTINLSHNRMGIFKGFRIISRRYIETYIYESPFRILTMRHIYNYPLPLLSDMIVNRRISIW